MMLARIQSKMCTYTEIRLFVNSVAKAKRTTRLRECTLLCATAAVQCRCLAYSHHSLSNILHVCSFFTSSTVKTGSKYMNWVNTGRGHFRQKEINPQIYTAKKAYRIHVRNVCGRILLDLIARRYTWSRGTDTLICFYHFLTKPPRGGSLKQVLAGNP